MTIHFENQKKELGNIIEKKKAKKKEHMTLRVREKEQRKMATLVAKQSQQMLELLAAKQEELKQEVVKELVSIRIKLGQKTKWRLLKQTIKARYVNKVLQQAIKTNWEITLAGDVYL